MLENYEIDCLIYPKITSKICCDDIMSVEEVKQEFSREFPGFRLHYTKNPLEISEIEKMEEEVKEDLNVLDCLRARIIEIEKECSEISKDVFEKEKVIAFLKDDRFENYVRTGE